MIVLNALIRYVDYMKANLALGHASTPNLLYGSLKETSYLSKFVRSASFPPRPRPRLLPRLGIATVGKDEVKTQIRNETQIEFEKTAGGCAR